MQQVAVTPQYFAGVDLAVRADHLAGVIDEHGCPVGEQLRFGRTHDEMERMFSYITSKVPEGYGLVWGCEATGAAWRPVTAYLLGKGEQVSLENPAAVAALRDVDSRFFKSDEVDARTIAELLFIRTWRGKEPHAVPSPELAATRSLARRVEGMCNELSSAKTRFTAFLIDLAVPSLKPSDHEWTGPTLLSVLDEFPDARQIAGKSLSAFIKAGKRIGGPRTSEPALTKLHEAATQAVRCFGEDGLDYDTHAWMLQDAILAIRQLESRIAAGRERLQQQLDKTRTQDEVEHGLSVPGVGAATLDILMAFYGPVEQWSTFRAMKRFAGMVPVVNQSGHSESTPRMSKLGEPSLRKVIFQIGQVARRYDAYFAATYYDQMVRKGKGHVAACIATGLRVLNCLRAVLRDGRPYQYRDPRTGEAITKEHSRLLAQTDYVVPEDVRAQRAKTKRNAHAQPDTATTSPKRPRRKQAPDARPKQHQATRQAQRDHEPTQQDSPTRSRPSEGHAEALP